MANRLLAEIGSPAAVLHASPARLSAVCDDDLVDTIGVVRDTLAACLRREALDGPVLSTAAALLDYLFVTSAHLRVEEVRGLYLDARHRLIADEVVSRGTLTEAPLYPREIIRRALDLGAAGLILSHNHPSGDATPSVADLLRTKGIADALRAVDIRLHDHIIIARSGEVSLRALGYL